MALNCPYCRYEFKLLAANSDQNQLPPLAPLLCESCLKISLWQAGRGIRTVTDEELVQIKKSQAYKTVLAPMIRMIETNRRRQKAGLN